MKDPFLENFKSKLLEDYNKEIPESERGYISYSNWLERKLFDKEEGFNQLLLTKFRGVARQQSSVEMKEDLQAEDHLPVIGSLEEIKTSGFYKVITRKISGVLKVATSNIEPPPSIYSSPSGKILDCKPKIGFQTKKEISGSYTVAMDSKSNQPKDQKLNFGSTSIPWNFDHIRLEQLNGIIESNPNKSRDEILCEVWDEFFFKFTQNPD